MTTKSIVRAATRGVVRDWQEVQPGRVYSAADAASLLGVSVPTVISRARGGVAVAAVTTAGVCGGCRVSIRPQAVQELRSATGLMVCESCGRYLHWQE